MLTPQASLVTVGRVAAMAALLSTGAACRSATPAPEVASVVVEPRPATSSPPVEREPLARETAPAQQLLGAKETMGAACQADSEPRRGGPSCGSNGRISMQTSASAMQEWSMGNNGTPPCAPVTLGSRERVAPYEVSACMTDGLLLVLSRCVMCRMPDMGTATLANPSELTPIQWEHLGRVASPPLSNAAEWREAIARGRLAPAE